MQIFQTHVFKTHLFLTLKTFSFTIFLGFKSCSSRSPSTSSHQARNLPRAQRERGAVRHELLQLPSCRWGFIYITAHPSSLPLSSMQKLLHLLSKRDLSTVLFILLQNPTLAIMSSYSFIHVPLYVLPFCWRTNIQVSLFF